MNLEQLLNWLLLPALGGLAWIARSVSRLETEVAQLKVNNTEMRQDINKHAEDLAHVRESVAKIEGRLDK